MINLLILLTLNCPQTIIINKTDNWSPANQRSYKYAKLRCSTLFPKTAPCLKTFIKTGYNSFRAICAKGK